MKKEYVGGQAVIEGVMMKAKDNIAIAVRTPSKKITVKKEKYNSLAKKFPPFKWPFIRGTLNLIEMMSVGIKAISFSTNESLGEDDEKVSNWELALTVLFSISLSFGLFYFLPLWLTSLFKGLDGLWFNIIDGLIRIMMVILYIGSIGLIKDIKRVFQYHGAEHKTVNCYEAGLPLTPENAQKFSVIHPRCGTSFIFIVMIISIIVFSIFDPKTFLTKFLSRLLLLPVIAGISYEILKFSADHLKNPVLRLLISPGLAMQKMTTRKPNKKQLEVAIAALEAVL